MYLIFSETSTFLQQASAITSVVPYRALTPAMSFGKGDWIQFEIVQISFLLMLQAFPEMKRDICVLPLRDFRPHHTGHLQSDSRLRKDVQT